MGQTLSPSCIAVMRLLLDKPLKRPFYLAFPGASKIIPQPLEQIARAGFSRGCGWDPLRTGSGRC